MEIRRYSYIDVYYNDDKDSIKEAMKERKRIESMGYELMSEDAHDGHNKETGDGYDFCDQYLKHHTSRVK